MQWFPVISCGAVYGTVITDLNAETPSSADTPQLAERLALSAAQRLFDTGGASATRTLASHNQLAHRAHVTGDFLVNGTWPPATGYFRDAGRSLKIGGVGHPRNQRVRQFS